MYSGRSYLREACRYAVTIRPDELNITLFFRKKAGFTSHLLNTEETDLEGLENVFFIGTVLQNRTILQSL